MTTTATLVHHQGSGTVEGFERIKEVDEQRQTLRVFYPEPAEDLMTSYTEDGEVYYEDYHGARIVDLDVDDDDEDGGSDLITVDQG